MKAVKQLLFVVLIGLVMVSVARAGEKESQTSAPGMNAVYQSRFVTTLQAGEYEMQTVIADFPQGVGVPNHMHGGYVLVTVLSGEMTLKEKGSEKIIRAGENWTENPGDVHSVVNAGTATARVVINMLLPKGAEPTTIIKQ
jgi:quercetin dioxygenase-like cupin family protein